MSQTIVSERRSEFFRVIRTGLTRLSSVDVPALLRGMLFPLIGIGVFLMIWQFAANRIDTSLGQFPGPVQVWEQVQGLAAEHKRSREKERAFYERQEARNAKKLAKNPDAVIKWRSYTGKPSFVDQVITSLKTVSVGYLLDRSMLSLQRRVSWDKSAVLR